jgi:membrane fusion protein, heavy metal efflux system
MTFKRAEEGSWKNVNKVFRRLALRGVPAIVLLATLAGCGAEKPAAAPPQESSKAPPAEASSSRQMADITTSKAISRTVPQRLQTTARLALNENATWHIGSVTAGRVMYVYAKVGDQVSKSDVLARLHSHDIHESRAEYRKAKAELTRLLAQKEYTSRQSNRARRLFELKAGSQQQVESAEAELRNVETALQAAQIELQRATQHLEDFLGVPAEDPHDSSPDAPEEEAGLVPVRAPADGIVMERNVTPGTVVDASAKMFTVSDLQTVWAVLSVNEEYLSRLRLGQPVDVFVQAFPNQPFRGLISWIGEELDPATRTVQVRVALANKTGKLKPEMYAKAEIEMGGETATLLVPQESLQEVNGETVLFVQTAPGRFEVRTVQPGQPLGDLVEIRNGLREGETIAVKGSFVLKSQLLRASLAEE